MFVLKRYANDTSRGVSIVLFRTFQLILYVNTALGSHIMLTLIVWKLGVSVGLELWRKAVWDTGAPR
jgi:hypothetical protein